MAPVAAAKVETAAETVLVLGVAEVVLMSARRSPSLRARLTTSSWDNPVLEVAKSVEMFRQELRVAIASLSLSTAQSWSLPVAETEAEVMAKVRSALVDRQAGRELFTLGRMGKLASVEVLADLVTK